MQIYAHLEDYRYSLADAATLSGASEKAVRNHIARGTLAVGRKHWLGRHEFTMLDIVRLTLVRVLTQNLAISLDEAATVAEALIPCVRGTAWPVDVLLMARGDDGAWEAGSANIADNPPGLRRRPHLRFPVAAIVDDLHARVGIAPVLGFQNAAPGFPGGAAGPRAANTTSSRDAAAKSEEGREPAPPSPTNPDEDS